MKVRSDFWCWFDVAGCFAVPLRVDAAHTNPQRLSNADLPDPLCRVRVALLHLLCVFVLLGVRHATRAMCAAYAAQTTGSAPPRRLNCLRVFGVFVARYHLPSSSSQIFLPMAKNDKDIFCGHCRRDLRAVAGVETAKGFIASKTNYSTWVDVHQLNKTEADMRAGVKNAKGFIAFINGPIVNPEAPDDDPIMNAYYNRPFCILELEQAIESGIPVAAVIHPSDKPNVGALISGFPEHLRGFVGGLEFIVLDRSDPEVRLLEKWPLQSAHRPWVPSNSGRGGSARSWSGWVIRYHVLVAVVVCRRA